MNIFVLDENPILSAWYLCDQHVNKMLLESAQILSNCYSLRALCAAPKTKDGETRKHSYPHHSCCKWSKKTYGNFEWLLLHAIAIEEERLFRGYKHHYTFSFIEWCANNKPDNLDSYSLNMTDFAIAIPPTSNCREIKSFDSMSPVNKYRSYYIHDKLFATWKSDLRRPAWYKKIDKQ